MSYPAYYKTDQYIPVEGYIYNTTSKAFEKTTTTPPPPTGDLNKLTVAANKVIASANDGNVPGNVVDGSATTRWSAQGVGQWIQLDLGGKRNVGKVEIDYYQGNARTSKGELFLDNNKVASIASETSKPTTTITLDPAKTAGELLKIIGQGNSVNDWNSINEIRVFVTGEVGPGPIEPPPIEPEPKPEPTTGKDKFGIKMLFPSVSGGRQFSPPDTPPTTSAVNATKRVGTTEMVAHGQGSVTPGKDYYKLAGSAPRMYIYDDGRNDLWKANIEITCYYNLVSKSSTSYAGFVMGGPSRHEAGGSTALAYYLKHHYSSKKFYLMKEQQHGGSGNAGYVDNASASPTSPVDLNKWYGAKLVVRTSADGKSVKLEGYKDDTGGANGGDWKKLTEKIDNGSWNTYAPFKDGTSCMFRTDGVTDFRYKWFSVRTIPGL